MFSFTLLHKLAQLSLQRFSEKSMGTWSASHTFFWFYTCVSCYWKHKRELFLYLGKCVLHIGILISWVLTKLEFKRFVRRYISALRKQNKCFKKVGYPGFHYTLSYPTFALYYFLFFLFSILFCRIFPFLYFPFNFLQANREKKNSPPLKFLKQSGIELFFSSTKHSLFMSYSKTNK